MKYLNKLSSVFCTAALGLLALTGCEGGDIYNVGSPDWISDKVDSIANANTSDVPSISPLVLGATDNSDAFWASHLDADILVPSNKVYTVGFTNYSSGANNWNNYYVVLRNKAKDAEYAVLRSDDYGWSTNFDNGYSLCTHSNTGSADWTSWLAAMNGAHVTVTVTNYGDNTADVVATVEGTDGNTYVQSYLGIGVVSTDLYLDFTTDGCHYEFDKAEVDVADAIDQEPVSLELVDMPAEVTLGTSFEDFTANIKANVTFDGGSTREIAAKDLTFMIVPDDLNTVGEKYLVATYSKTMFGKNTTSTAYGSATFNVVQVIKSIAVTQAPTRTNYYIYTSAATTGVTDRTLLFDPTGMIVTAEYEDGSTAVVDNANLTFSSVPAKNGSHEVTITTANGKTAKTNITVSASTSSKTTPNPTNLGADDNSTGFYAVNTDDVKVPAGETYEFNFTNYSSLAGNWNNFVVVLRNSEKVEACLVRADNFGWRGDFAFNTADHLDELGWILSGGQTDWGAWLAAMNGAKVTVYVTNCNNGTADIQVVMKGTDGNTYTQYYLGITSVDLNDLNVIFTVDGSHLVFE